MREVSPLLMKRTRHGLEAVDSIDNERLESIPLGQDIEVTIKKRRSNLQQRLYWKMLGEVVQITEKYPTSQHLHDEIKMALGYIEKRVTFTGQIYYRADSTAFDKMDGREFKVFFDRAVKLMAEHLNINPLEFYDRSLP